MVSTASFDHPSWYVCEETISMSWTIPERLVYMHSCTCTIVAKLFRVLKLASYMGLLQKRSILATLSFFFFLACLTQQLLWFAFVQQNLKIIILTGLFLYFNYVYRVAFIIYTSDSYVCRIISS